MSNKYTIIGPRISELGGFDPEAAEKQEAYKKVINSIVIENQKAGNILLSSCALGVEMWALEAALANNAPYDLYVPFDNFEKKWPKSGQSFYRECVKKAGEVIQTGTGDFDPKKLGEKDKQMFGAAKTVYHFYLILPKYIKLEGKEVIAKLEDVQSDEFIAF